MSQKSKRWGPRTSSASCSSCRIAIRSSCSIASTTWTGTTSCVGVKNVTINEPFFQGHFPQYPGHAGRAHHRRPGADGGRAVRAQSRQGLQGRARLLHGHRPRQVPQAGAARATSSTITSRRSAIAAASGGSSARRRSTARPWPRPRSAPCWPTRQRLAPSQPARRPKMGEMRAHPTAVIEARRQARRRRQDRPLLRRGRASRARRRRRARQPRGRRRPHHDRCAHAHLSVRLDRASAAGPQIQGRALHAQRSAPTASSARA